MNLVARNASERAARSANLVRDIGQRCTVVPSQGRSVGELEAGQLHAVARVATKPDGCLVQLSNLLFRCCLSYGSHRVNLFLDPGSRTEDVGVNDNRPRWRKIVTFASHRMANCDRGGGFYPYC